MTIDHRAFFIGVHQVVEQAAKLNQSWRHDKTSSERGYGYKWQKARADWLSAHPLCVYCMKQGRVSEATVVDHIVPHRGDLKLFWNRRNWQSLCKTCHDSVKAAEERSGRVGGCGLDGLPLDAKHHWNSVS